MMELRISDEVNEEIIKQKNERIKRNQNQLLISFAVIFLLGYFIFFTSNFWMPRSYENARITPIGSTVEGNDRKVTLLSWTYCEEQNLMEVMLDITNLSIDGIEEYSWSALDRNEGMCDVEIIVETNNFVVLHLKVPRRWTRVALRMDADPAIADQKTADFQTIRLYTSKRAIDIVTSVDTKSEREYRIWACDLKIGKYQNQIEKIYERINELNQTMENADARIEELQEKLSYQTESEKAETLTQIGNLQSAKSIALSDKQEKGKEVKELKEKIENQKKLKASL